MWARPIYKSGYASLPIDPESRRLKVSARSGEEGPPPGRRGRSGRVGHGPSGQAGGGRVDDVGRRRGGFDAHRATRRPDPIPTFTAPRALAVIDGGEPRGARSHLFACSLSAPWRRQGGRGGGGGGEATRRDFRATAWFQAGVLTGDSGRTHVRFKLPDNLTTFRVMAVAVAQGRPLRVGRVTRDHEPPLMAAPGAAPLPPRRRHDDARRHRDDQGHPGVASVEVTRGREGLTVSGDATRTVDVPAGGSVEVRWPIDGAARGAGEAGVSARGRAAESDARRSLRSDVDSPGGDRDRSALRRDE